MDKNYTSTTSSTTSRKKKKIKCSFCEQNEASIILTDTSKPLCLLHYYTTRSCRSNNLIHNNNNNKKIRIIGNEAEFEQQKINVQLLFAQAFDELRREIAEEVVKPSTAAAFRPVVNGKGAAPQQQQQKLDEKDPLSVLFDAPRRKKPQKELLQRQQQRMQRQQQQQPVATMDRKPMRKMNKPTKTNDVSKLPISNVMGAQRRSPSPSPPSQSKRHSIPNTTMPKRRSLTLSPPPLTNPPPPPPPPPKRQQKPQWQKIPQPSKQEESIENEGGFLRTATLPTKIIQHQKRQQEEIAKEERFITSTLYKNENDKNDEINIALQRQQRQNNNRGTNPYKRRKITSKSIWNLALDDTNTNPTNSNSNQLVNFDNENETILKPSTPCPQCNKIENVIYEGNIMTCRNDDVAKAETWGRKDRSDIVLMKCRCLDCGRVWNEDE